VQIEAIAREVGGDLIDLRGIVPAGADAHVFEPVASDLRAIADADVILRHGIGLDDWLDDTLGANTEATIVTVTDGITLQPPALEHVDEGGDSSAEEDGLDPHVWHDPDRAKIMVQNTARALGEADPEHRQSYEERAATYNSKLDTTKAQVQSIIDEIASENRKLVTNHDAFGYFADSFGLEIVGAVIPAATTEAEPSAEDTAELLEVIGREGVRAIFAESSVNADLAATLASDARVRIVDDLYGDSLGDPGSGAETIDGMLLANARKIADALK
jgi:ABC-type Zn uptake system ZnuABC Zn-binding protein ZnuA